MVRIEVELPEPVYEIVAGIATAYASRPNFAEEVTKVILQALLYYPAIKTVLSSTVRQFLSLESRVGY